MKRTPSNNRLGLISAFLVANLLTPAVFRRAAAQNASEITRPPVARVRPVVDDYFGTKVTDPYRYMEHLDNPEVAKWMKAQNDYTRRVLGRISGRDELLARIEQLDKSIPARVGGIVRLATGRYFYYKLLSTESVVKLYMRDGLVSQETLLVDPQKISGKETPSAINYFWPSSDGRYVAYGISLGGSEKAVLHIMDTETVRDTGETIDRAEFNDTVGWLPDGHSFIYNRLQKLRPHAQEEEREIKSRAYLHVIGTDPEHDNAVFGYGVSPLVKVEPADISLIATVPDVPFALGTVTHGSQNEISIYIAPLDSVGKPNTPWRKVCDVNDAVTGMTVRGDDLWLLTHKDAPRFKIIHTNLSNPDLSHAEVVVAPSAAVVTTLVAAQDALYVQLRDGAVDRLLRVGYETAAKPEPVVLPYDGSIGLYPPDVRASGVVFELSGWTKANRFYEYDPKTKKVVDTRLRPSAPFDNPEDIESEEVKVPAQDGTLIPLSIIYRRGLKLDGSNPVLLNGYGAYGSSLDPHFDPVNLAWLERGGVLAFAHVRGGGEFGDDWHKAGQKLTKPNTWHDFIACAEYLIERKYTSPARLAGEGESAGGILIGRSITERPDLFAAALIEVGFTDALRGELEQDGPGEIPEWGTVKDPEGFKGLYEMSAYAHVKNGTRYPAIMLTTGRNDPRVAPWESDKMTARLQAATSSGKPILLRVEYEAGHGIGSTKTQLEQELADEWSFLFWQFGDARFQTAASDAR
ncbi:MAG: prolyl oligopeptidase family serine peptidase [Candidatus Sulfotelmatobacter sp.]